MLWVLLSVCACLPAFALAGLTLYLRYTGPRRTLPTQSPDDVPRKVYSKTIAVVGAGAAGSAVAHELARHGFKVHVYEGEALAGGRAHTYRPPPNVDSDGGVSADGGWAVEAGAWAFGKADTLLWQYLERLQLRDQVVPVRSKVKVRDRDKAHVV